MAEDRTPTGPRLPTQAAIDIMNKNAAVVAKRSALGLQVASQQRIGRDALRRDRQVRSVSAETLAGLGEVQAVPEDKTPERQPLPTDLIRNLVSQFQGTGGTGGGGGGGGPSGGGGGGSGSGSGSGSGTGGGGSVGSGGGGTGVQTFVGTGAPWTESAYRNEGMAPILRGNYELRRGPNGYWQYRQRVITQSGGQ